MAKLNYLPLGNYIILFQYSENRFEVVSVIERHRDIVSMFDDEA